MSFDDLKQWADLLPALIAAWLAWVNRNANQTRRDLDNLYYEYRGKQGRRDRSMRGRIMRRFYQFRGK